MAVEGRLKRDFVASARKEETCCEIRSADRFKVRYRGEKKNLQILVGGLSEKLNLQLLKGRSRILVFPDIRFVTSRSFQLDWIM